MSRTHTSLHIIFSMLCLISITNTDAQSLDEKLGYTITLDPTIEMNASHRYIDEFSKKNPEYILWLYTANKTNFHQFKNDELPSKIYKNSGGNNSLVFTITKGTEVRYDTLRNSLHPGDYSTGGGFLGLRKLLGKIRGSRARRHLNIQGDLPEGAMSSISPKKWGLELAVLVPEPTAHVIVEVFDREEKKVATIIDEELGKGWNNFTWKRNDLKRGKYRARITMNEESLSLNFKM